MARSGDLDVRRRVKYAPRGEWVRRCPRNSEAARVPSGGRRQPQAGARSRLRHPGPPASPYDVRLTCDHTIIAASTLGARLALARGGIPWPGMVPRVDVSTAGAMTGREIVLVLPIDAVGCVYLVDIFRPLLDCCSLEVIGGGIEAGEAPGLAAARELLEETGIRARLVALGTHELSTAMFPIRQHLFLAQVESVGEPELEPFEQHTIRGLCRLPLADAVDLVLRGEIRGLSSVSLILKANEHLRREGRT